MCRVLYYNGPGKIEFQEMHDRYYQTAIVMKVKNSGFEMFASSGNWKVSDDFLGVGSACGWLQGPDDRGLH